MDRHTRDGEAGACGKGDAERGHQQQAERVSELGQRRQRPDGGGLEAEGMGPESGWRKYRVATEAL